VKSFFDFIGRTEVTQGARRWSWIKKNKYIVTKKVYTLNFLDNTKVILELFTIGCNRNLCRYIKLKFSIFLRVEWEKYVVFSSLRINGGFLRTNQFICG